MQQLLQQYLPISPYQFGSNITVLFTWAKNEWNFLDYNLCSSS